MIFDRLRRTASRGRGGWRITVLDHEREDGWPAARAASDVLARAGGDRITVHDGALVRLDADGKLRWAHACSTSPTEAYVSGDRLLVLTDSRDYGAWGLLGPALLLDLDDGTAIAELRGDSCAPAGGGRFLLGLEGYDVFDTWLHDRDGTVLTTWRSYGHYVVSSDGGIRVVECDRTRPTRSHVARLLPGGEVERGPRLADGQAPRPVVLDDETIIVLDGGVLRGVDRELNGTVLAELMPISPDQAWRFSGKLRLEGRRLTVTLTERSAEPPLVYTTDRWSLKLTR